MFGCIVVSLVVAAILIITVATAADYVMPRYMSRRTARLAGASVIIIIGLLLVWSVWECVKGG